MKSLKNLLGWALFVAVMSSPGWLVAACGGLSPEPTPEPPTEYIVGFGAAQVGPVKVPVIVTVRCSQRPNESTVAAVCNTEEPLAHVITPTEWEEYQVSDPYPSINP